MKMSKQVRNAWIKEITELKDRLVEYRDALRWCSAASDLQPGGKARKGWLKIAHLCLDD